MPRKKREPRFRVYLAGPITDCNEAQVFEWRKNVKRRWADEFVFIDPTDQLVPRDKRTKEASYEIISRDERDIKRADAILANMWKESIGTAIGIVLARKEGKPVVVIDKNHLGSRVLAYYADAICDKEEQAIKQLTALLRQQDEITGVLKKNSGEEEPFSREKLAKSIRKACQAAGHDDLIATSRILPEVIDKIINGRKAREGIITTSDIKKCVWNVLAELESDPQRFDDFAGIREAWEIYDRKEKGGPLDEILASRSGGSPLRDKPQSVPVETGKDHSTIWGKNINRIEDLPPSPREVFMEICRVEGISRIKFNRFTSKPSASDKCVVQLMASNTPKTIEGKCYDNGEKGSMQRFQIITHNEEDTERVRRTLLRHLAEMGHARTRGEDAHE